MPASIDLEFSSATFTDPHTGSVRAPVASFNARTVGNLPGHGYSSGSAKIDSAEPVLVVLTLADDIEARIPTRLRSPATVVTIVTVAAIVTMVVPITAIVAPVVMVSSTRSDKTPRAATVHPQPMTIDAPILVANTTRIGQLTNQARIAPGNMAARSFHIAALAIHGIAVTVFLGTHDSVRGHENQYQSSQGCQTMCHERSSGDENDGASATDMRQLGEACAHATSA